MEETSKILVVNADDFGLSKAINRGIISAFENGILTSTSLMANGESFEDAVSLAKSHYELGVGIHFSFVDEKCVAPIKYVKGLTDKNGNLPGSYIKFVRNFCIHKFGIAQIRSEMQGQLQKVLDSGIKLTHIDSHQHLHCMPSIFRETCILASQVGIPFIRLPIERGNLAGLPKSRAVQVRILGLLSKICKGAAKFYKIRTVNNFRGLSCSGNMNEANLLEAITSTQSGINEIMCHPGLSDIETYSRYQWGYNWEDEYNALISQSVRKTIDALNIRLSSFRDI